ncbi:hypothetical protein R2083_07995 [Nitrosomonas sp. Is35]|uniref:hypothetical protein n=1 Tax=Nitrosomonas sp. Is35 TaxID=3080534 RepID=UPI00294B77DE|nr:hypothetical protein [Nitrosomonas sp. Is35]MDV6347454.1 hypothetical protein [Nitrosomonas sp. Is35]
MPEDRLYIQTDINIPIVLSGDITAADVVDMSVTMTMTKDQSITSTFKLSEGAINIIADSVTLRVPKTAITTPGVYNIFITVTDTDSKLRGLTPKPLTLTFYTNH